MRVYCSLVKQTEPELGNVSQICAFDPFTIHHPRDERLSDKLLIHTAFRPEDEGIKAASEEAHHISPNQKHKHQTHPTTQKKKKNTTKTKPNKTENKNTQEPPNTNSRIV